MTMFPAFMYMYRGESHSKNYVAVPPVLANRGSIEQESLEDIFIQYSFIHSFFQQCSSTARYLWYHLVSCHFPPTPYVTLDAYRPQVHSHLGTFVLLMSGVLFSPVLIPLFHLSICSNVIPSEISPLLFILSFHPAHSPLILPFLHSI